MVSRRLSTTGVRFSVIRYPPRNQALLTVGFPARRLDLDGITAFRTHELRPGRAPSIPQGRRCSPRSEDRAQPAPAASQRHVPRPRLQPFHLPVAPVDEASTRVQAIHPSGLPLAHRRPDGTSNSFGFPLSFAPRRPRAGQRTSRAGTGHRARTWTTLHGISRTSNPALSLMVCDLASHRSKRQSPAESRGCASE